MRNVEGLLKEGEYSVVVHVKKVEVNFNSDAGRLVRSILDQTQHEIDATEYIYPTGITVSCDGHQLAKDEEVQFWRQLQGCSPELRPYTVPGILPPPDSLTHHLCLVRSLQSKLSNTELHFEHTMQACEPKIEIEQDVGYNYSKHAMRAAKVGNAAVQDSVGYMGDLEAAHQCGLISRRLLDKNNIELLTFRLSKIAGVGLKWADRGLGFSANLLKRREFQPVQRGRLGELEDVSLAATEICLKALFVKQLSRHVTKKIAIQIASYGFPGLGYVNAATTVLNILIMTNGWSRIKSGLKSVVPQYIQDSVHFSRYQGTLLKQLKEAAHASGFKDRRIVPVIKIQFQYQSADVTTTQSAATPMEYQQVALTFKDISTLEQFGETDLYHKLFGDSNELSQKFIGSGVICHSKNDTLEIEYKDVSPEVIADIIKIKQHGDSFKFQNLQFYRPTENSEGKIHFYLDLIHDPQNNPMQRCISINPAHSDYQVGVVALSVAGGQLAFNPGITFSTAVGSWSSFLTGGAIAGGLFTCAFAIAINEVIKIQRRDSWPAEKKRAYDYQECYSKLVTAIKGNFGWRNYGINHIGDSWEELYDERVNRLKNQLSDQLRICKSDVNAQQDIRAHQFDLETKNWEGIKKWDEDPEGPLKRLSAYFIVLNDQINDCYKLNPSKMTDTISKHVTDLARWFPGTFATYFQQARLQDLQGNNLSAISLLKDAQKNAQDPSQSVLVSVMMTKLLFLEMPKEATKDKVIELYTHYNKANSGKDGCMLSGPLIEACCQLFYENYTRFADPDKIKAQVYSELCNLKNPELDSNKILMNISLEYMNNATQKVDSRKEAGVDHVKVCIDACDRILSLEQSNFNAMLNKAFSLLKQGNIEDAATLYQHIIAACPKFDTEIQASANFNLASIRIHEKNVNSAILFLQSGLDYNPQCHKQRKVLADLYMHQKEYKLAQGAYLKILSDTPQAGDVAAEFVRVSVICKNMDIAQSQLKVSRQAVQQQLMLLEQQKSCPDLVQQIEQLNIQKQTLDQIQQGFDDYETGVINCDLGGLFGRISSMGLRYYAAQREPEGKPTQLARVARVAATTLDLGMMHVASYFTIQNRTNLYDSLSLSSTENYTNLVLMNPSVLLHSAAMITRGLVEAGCEQKHLEMLADSLEVATSTVSTVDSMNKLRYYLFDESSGSLCDFDPIMFGGRIAGNAFSSWVRSKKINRQFMCEHPAAYAIADTTKALLTTMAILAGLNKITKGRIVALVKLGLKRLPYLWPAITTNPLLAGVTIISATLGGYYIYKGLDRLKNHYSQEGIDALIFNASLELSMAETLEHKAEQAYHSNSLKESEGLKQEAAVRRQSSREKLLHVLKRYPDNQAARNELEKSKILQSFERKEYVEVVSHSTRVIDAENNAHNEMFYRLLCAQACDCLGRYDLVKRILKTCPNHVEAMTRLGLLELRLSGNTFYAKNIFSDAYQLVINEIEKISGESAKLQDTLIDNQIVAGAHHLVKECPVLMSFWGVNAATFKERHQIEYIESRVHQLTRQKETIEQLLQDIEDMREGYRRAAQGAIGAEIVQVVAILLQQIILELQDLMMQDRPSESKKVALKVNNPVYTMSRKVAVQQLKQQTRQAQTDHTSRFANRLQLSRQGNRMQLFTRLSQHNESSATRSRSLQYIF